LSANQIEQSIQQDDTLLIRVCFLLQPSLGCEVLNVDEIVDAPYKVNKMPYFKNFIEGVVEPDENQNDFNTTIGSDGVSQLVVSF
jgi:chemotaxis signal transduction protein